jgi:hypothetical protein
LSARGSNPQIEVATEELTLTLKGSMLSAAKAKGLTVWYSNLSSSNVLGVNPAEEQVFQKLSKPLVIDSSGNVKLSVHPEEIYTVRPIVLSKTCNNVLLNDTVSNKLNVCLVR